ncbi:cyclase family protein [Candidatus Merdisoma sp. JLR.KK006]|jgi:kynurenine formamidase|uniref:cyclase family protein n=1 Tax=Candidatus Merdisoma sp. JLR.KK006 TaxID=3112626 RepID=UPI002FF355A5
MRRIIDITGKIDHGMWNYDPPFTSINIKPLPPIGWLGGQTVGAELFEGVHSQTGTYLETPAHYFGNDNSYLLSDVPAERTYEVPCVVLNIGMFNMDLEKGRHGITVEELEACKNVSCIKEGDAILVGTGWGRYWFDPHNLDGAPYFTRDAMMWLIDKKPFILGADSARWDNLEEPQGFFQTFYEANILMAGPFVNLEQCTAERCKLTILAANFMHTSCAPARALIIED